MLQIVDGKKVFVVDLLKKPNLPITDGGISEFAPYAEALTDAIEKETITEFPGKYAIGISGLDWTVYKVIE